MSYSARNRPVGFYDNVRSALLIRRKSSKTAHRKDQRRLITDAATRVLFREGYIGVTIDSIAAEAAMSKGGVFYYFKNKNEILLGIVDRYAEKFDSRRDEIYASLPQGPNSFLKAFVLASLENYEDTKKNLPNAVGMMNIPEFRIRVGRMKRKFYKELTQKCRHPAKVAMIIYVLDGLWMDHALEVPCVPRDCDKDVFKELMEYVDSIAKEFE